MATTSLRKASLQSMEAEIESLLKSLESLKDDASDESRKTLKVLKSKRRKRTEAFAPSAQRRVRRSQSQNPRNRDCHTGLRPGTPLDYSGCGCGCAGLARCLSAVQARRMIGLAQFVLEPLRQLPGAPVRGALG